jgi:hypothetical protein
LTPRRAAREARVGALLASLATLGTAAPAYAATPTSIAADVHARGGYPDEIEIGACESGVCPVPGVGVVVSGEPGRGQGDAPRGAGSGTDRESGLGGRPGEQGSGGSSADPSGAGAQSQGADPSGTGTGARGANEGAARSGSGKGAGRGDGLDGEAGSPGAGSAERARERERRRAARKSAKVPETIVVLGGGAGLASMLVLVVVIALLVVFFVWLLSLLGPRAELPAATEPAHSPAAPGLDAPFTLEDFDALANAGRLEQAVLALLLHSLSAGGWRAEGTGKSRTAREVVSSLLDSDPRRAVLSEIVALSEAVRFGGAAATRERFEAMRARFEHLRKGIA